MNQRKRKERGDDPGISRVPEADSESVDELLDEGQPYEAEVIEGVEEASDHPERPVQSHEVPEDDVPEEYRNPRDGD
ncbi:MAG TPA: hypothetical protein VFP94_08860 [Terriglobales bacterium]|nr:hypothetical protein [Terriglobales bacterium]